MALSLNNLKPSKGSVHKKKRVGRGPGSGLGKTAGRGEKGQKSRSGYSAKIGFEGGQMPLHRRLPKRGFTNIFKKKVAIVNVGVLQELSGDTFDPGTLLELGVIRKLEEGLKVLGSGELKRKITIKANLISESARKKIEAAGGSVELIGGTAKN
jgi:large subunit ribosomal protein L15